MRLLISGGPGSGCTSTAKLLGEQLNLPIFDSDAYFHKPTNPPFQEPYSPAERRERLGSELAAQSSWILSGSVALWDVDPFEPTHGVYLQIACGTRLQRLLQRQEKQFGSRIQAGGDMHEEHESFMEWAAGYEIRTDRGRNLVTDRAFLESRCPSVLILTEDSALDKVVKSILHFLAENA